MRFSAASTAFHKRSRSAIHGGASAGSTISLCTTPRFATKSCSTLRVSSPSAEPERYAADATALTASTKRSAARYAAAATADLPEPRPMIWALSL